MYINPTSLCCFSEPNARKIRKINPSQAYTTEKTGDIVVPWHEKDELFIFSSSGDHLETRSLFSDSTLLKSVSFTAYLSNSKFASTKVKLRREVSPVEEDTIDSVNI